MSTSGAPNWFLRRSSSLHTAWESVKEATTPGMHRDFSAAGASRRLRERLPQRHMAHLSTFPV
jgi:hypothetical protein